MESEKKITTEIPITPPTPVEPKTGWMPHKTILLFLLLLVITMGLLAIALIPNVKNLTVAKPTPVPSLTYAQTNLSVSTPVSTALNSYSTDVLISTGSNKITAAQLEISYDPTVLTNVTIEPGPFFTTPVVLLKKIDTVNGKISYALSINPSQKPISGSGTVATVTFSTISGAAAMQTPINFEPKTAVTAVGYAQSVLKQANGVIFTLPATPTPTQ